MLAAILAYLGGAGCGRSAGPPSERPAVTRLVANYYVNLPGTSPSTMKVTFDGCLLGQDGICSQSVTFHELVEKADIPPSCLSVGPSCVPRIVPLVKTPLMSGTWLITASSAVAANVSCRVLVAAGSTSTVHLNRFNATPGLECIEATVKLAVTQAFTINPESTITLASSSAREVLHANGGKINLADDRTIRDLDVSLDDVTIRGIRFENIHLHNLGVVYPDVQGGTAQVGIIRAGMMAFETTFVANGEAVQMVLIPGDVALTSTGFALRLRGHFELDADPQNPLRCPFSALSDAFPLTVDVDLVAIDPPARRRAVGP